MEPSSATRGKRCMPCCTALSGHAVQPSDSTLAAAMRTSRALANILATSGTATCACAQTAKILHESCDIGFFPRRRHRIAPESEHQLSRGGLKRSRFSPSNWRRCYHQKRHNYQKWSSRAEQQVRVAFGDVDKILRGLQSIVA